MKKKLSMLDISVHLILLIITICILYPVLHVVAVSFSGNYAIMANEVTIFPKDFTISSYKYILEKGGIVHAFLNSVLYTVVGVFVNVVMTVMMAYPLSKEYLVGRSFWVKFTVFTMFFTGGMIPTFLVVKEVGLLDSMWSQILPNAIWTMELMVMIRFIRAIPNSLCEAAYLDGASELQVLTKVILPNLKAPIATCSLTYFMGHWNDYFIAMLYLFDDEKFPLQLILRSMLLEEQRMAEELQGALTPTGVKNATIVLAMIPVLLIYPIAQKFFVKGLMAGSVKE